MDTAYCKIDNKHYHIMTFAQLEPSELQQKRRHLTCPECGWQAYFKRAATSGQGACFGARPHAPDCSLAALPSEKGPGSSEVRDMLRNPMDHIVIDLNYGAHKDRHVDGEESESVAKVRGGRFTGPEERGPSKMNRRLRPLLKALISSEQFRHSSAMIELPRHTSLPANQFFVHFNDISEEHEGGFHGYWGLVFDTGMSQNRTFWLNTGEYDALSVMLPAELYADFKRRAGFRFDHELEGMHVLVLGHLRRARSEKLYIEVESLDRCTLCDD